VQDKSAEVAFFDAHAAEQEYDVFTPGTSRRIVRACLGAAGLGPGARVADLGCGSGVFTALAREEGVAAVGLDLSSQLLAVGRRRYPGLALVAGDVEALPFASGSLDGVLLSGVLHHLPDPSACAREVQRVLKPGGSFAAFDPNRRNPFMWLYRDRSSPLYSRVGVTANERPVVAEELRRVFERAGLAARTSYLSGLRYRYVASGKLRWALPLYNAIDDVLFRAPFLSPYAAFVLTSGRKSEQGG
jgi:ubiquinone/menaquinone biosynthesis C-methylase UbiE